MEHIGDLDLLKTLKTIGNTTVSPGGFSPWSESEATSTTTNSPGIPLQ